MAITHTSRTGNTYYLHTGPRRGGGVQHFFSTKSSGSLADELPAGFEIHESVNGQVFLRRAQPRLIREEETTIIERGLEKQRGLNLYKLETRGSTLTIHESQDTSSGLGDAFPWIGSQKKAELRERFAHYQPVMRFILVDDEKRLFAPERYCFRGSVEDWIPIGPPEPMKKLAAKYLKHLGRESFFELY
jgi:hypothetical protein